MTPHLLLISLLPHANCPATDLCDQDYAGTSDAYVEVELYQSDCSFACSYQKQQTPTVGGSLNPIWDENLVFSTDLGLDDIVLEMTVWDNDRWNFDDKNGRVALHLAEQPFQLGIPVDFEYPLATKDGLFNLSCPAVLRFAIELIDDKAVRAKA